MTTDTAVNVTVQVVLNSSQFISLGNHILGLYPRFMIAPLDQIPYVNRPDISFGGGASVEMPFKYIATSSGEPILPKGMKELLRADLDKDLTDELF
jgi:hypothetical protein